MKRSLFCILTGLMALTACDAPRFEGPMVQALPNGFIREATAAQDHEIFPERSAVTRDAYVVFGDTEFSGIYIRKHAGGTTRQEVEEARDAAAEIEAPKGVRYGEIEDILVDGNTGWGWIEERYDDQGLQAVEYRVVVPYADSVTYTVEFTSAKYNWTSQPDSMRFIATSFTIGKVAWDYPMIALILVGSYLVLSFFWKKFSPMTPSTNYTLHPMPVADAEDGAATGSAATAGAPDATDATGATPENDTGAPPRTGG